MSTQNVTPQEFSYLKEQLTARMIQILVEEHGYTMEEAIDKIYTSPIYEKLSDANTGLFSSRPATYYHTLLTEERFNFQNLLKQIFLT
jgi:arsenate reductase-like glutaredoxin family protein